MSAAARAPRDPAGWAVAGLLLNALVWGTSWWPFRKLMALGLHPLWSTVLIYAASLIVILAVRPGALMQFVRTPGLWLLMLAAGTTNAAFNWATVIGDVVRVVLLFYLMPLWTVLLARLFLGEPITRAALLRVALALAGAALVLWPQRGAPVSDHGSLPDLLALVGGMTFALNNVLLRRQAHRPQEGRAFAMFAGGMVVSASIATALGWQHAAPWPSLAATWLLPVAALALLFLLGNLALQYGAARLPANATSVVMLSEVLFATLSSWWWQGGVVLRPAMLVGGACIVAAAALAALASG